MSSWGPSSASFETMAVWDNGGSVDGPVAARPATRTLVQVGVWVRMIVVVVVVVVMVVVVVVLGVVVLLLR